MCYNISCPDSSLSVQTEKNKKYKIKLGKGTNTNIGVKITIGHIPQKAKLSVNINNRIEVLDWQDGQTYIFKTLDNSGHCSIEFIGENNEEHTGLGAITISYFELVNGEIGGFDDRLTYYNTVIGNRKAKYIGQPMSVLIQDLDLYQVPLVDQVVSTNDINYGRYNFVTLYFDDPIKAIDGWGGLRYMDLFVEYENSYDSSEIYDIDVENDWGIEYKNAFAGKIVKDILFREIE